MNKETLDIFGQLLSGKQLIIGKARQTGKSWSNAAWKQLHSKYERAQDRKERIKSIFNI